MKNVFPVFKTYLPPYKKEVILNILFNILGALFGAFSFATFSPVLAVLFGTQKRITDPNAFHWSMDSILNHFSYFVTKIINTYGEAQALFILGIVMVIMVFFKVGFTYMASFMMVPIRNGVVRDIRIALYKKIVSLPIAFFSEERKGDIMARMTGDVTEVETSIMNSLEMFFKNPVIILISLFAMIYMSWQLTIFVFVLLPLVGVLIGRIGKSLKKRSMAGQNKMGDILSNIDETLGGLRIIKSFNAEEKVSERFNNESTEYKNIMDRLMRRYFLAHPMSELLGTMVIVIVLWYGGRLVLNNTSPLAPQDFITYLIFFYSIINPAKAFSTALYSINKGLAAMYRIDHILDAENHIKDPENPIELSNFKEELEFKNVSFKYPNTDRYVLKNINVKIKKGETLAIVGKSGSGKSTFVDLIPRLFDVYEGEILVDGHNIKEYTKKDLRGLIGNVNQESILFNDSFENNITFGVPSASQEEIENAAKVANIHDYIDSTPNKYQTTIGDRGGKISGGQRQRVSIARAILKNPPIMILDEATSALDTESEKLVQDALENLMKNRTSIVVAHRLSTIKSADCICVFNDGEIVEQGTHNNLIQQDTYYKKLHMMQNA